MLNDFTADSMRMAERTLGRASTALWPLLRKYNALFERESPKPKWAPAPLLKKRERTFPQLGWPRWTDSLCPKCVRDVRTEILSGEKDLSTLIDGKPGEIKARIVEDGGVLK